MRPPTPWHIYWFGVGWLFFHCPLIHYSSYGLVTCQPNGPPPTCQPNGPPPKGPTPSSKLEGCNFKTWFILIRGQLKEGLL